MTAQWMERQQQAMQSLLQQGSNALRQNNVDLAQAALTEASIILDMAPEETVDVKQLRAQTFNELGVVHQRREDSEQARDFHEKAAKLCLSLVEDDGVDGFRGNAAATHLNLSNIYMGLGQAVEASEAIDRSVELVEHLLDDGEHEIRQMGVAVYMTKASLDASVGNFDEAPSKMERALELAELAIEDGHEQLWAQTAQGCQQLSVLMFQGEQYEEALRWGKEAERLSERAFEELGEDVVSIYIVSQINLISYNQELANFADAEDSLWKAIDLVGSDARLLRRGREFYEYCRTQADARLKKGDLPREEVEQGYEDLKRHIEEIGGIPDDLDEAEGAV